MNSVCENTAHEIRERRRVCAERWTSRCLLRSSVRLRSLSVSLTLKASARAARCASVATQCHA